MHDCVKVQNKRVSGLSLDDAKEDVGEKQRTHRV